LEKGAKQFPRKIPMVYLACKKYAPIILKRHVFRGCAPPEHGLKKLIIPGSSPKALMILKLFFFPIGRRSNKIEKTMKGS